MKLKSILSHRLFFAVISMSIVGLTARVAESKIIRVRADGKGRYPTIQAAIDTARPGDEVVLRPGTYTGKGNRNLNFHGKAITVRSVNPQSNRCMCRTIIDPEGVGVIVRFINDEGPGSVFEGFTLGAGDTSKGVRGAPGFFEFSKNARPTTRRLRNKIAQVADKSIVFEKYSTDFPGFIPPLGGRAWDGYNPFHQAANTTDYYGSGDVDNDGNSTTLDVSLAQDMADGIAQPVNRADVDGDGDVDNSDVLLIDEALSGGTLPAWWNSLTSRTQRNSWVNRVMAIDRTDERGYNSDFFVCHHFAFQTATHGSLLRADFSNESTEYDGGQTVFNVPMYFVSLNYHAINAILVGDDPLNFNDWRFIEPQNDSDVVPGAWNMLYDRPVNIMPPDPYWNAEEVVNFYVDANGWSLTGYSQNLVTSRPVPEEVVADNRPDLWNPRIITDESASILYERMREDMSRTTDIHIADLPFVDPPLGRPLILDDYFSRLLDFTQAPDDTIHLLWEGLDVFYRQTLFHGTMDPVELTVNNVTHVTGDLELAASGKIVVTPFNDIHVFWFENYGLEGSYEKGIHWTKWNGTGWDTPQILTVDIPQSSEADWINRNFALYVYDIVALDGSEVLLVWNEKINFSHYISQLIYDGSWNYSQIEDTGWDPSMRGLDLCRDSDGTVHLAYWHGNRESWGGMEEGRGNLYHRTFDGVTWSSPTVVDNSDGTCCPRMSAGPDGEIYLVWERKEGGRVFPVYNRYTDDNWGIARELGVRPDADAWYPIVERLPDGVVMAVWSSRSDDRVTIEMQQTEPAPPITQDGTAYTELGQTVIIELEAYDDGYPDPPGALTYIITSLPSHGSLSDPLNGPITAVPYAITDNNDNVAYTPDGGYSGLDEFTFKVSDGGVPPDGGYSNTSTITIEVSNCADIITGAGSVYWTLPMYTSSEDCRTQVIYLSSEIGTSGIIAGLALNVLVEPGQTLNNWTIRMKHTTMSTYDTASLDADGWTVVYQGNEPVGVSGWRYFEFFYAFEYNDSNNLMVDFSYNNDSSTTTGYCMSSTPGGTRSAYAFSDSLYGDPLEWSGTSSPHVYSYDRVPNLRLNICAEYGPAPPFALNGTAYSELGQTVIIDLEAYDDGYPDPPGALTYIITSLPSHGNLSDPLNGPITTVPYAITDYNDNVAYTPDGGYSGPDEFTFKTSDGGVPPDGGYSNTASITIEVSNCVDIITGTGTTYWTFPMHASDKYSRTQSIYLSDEIGTSGTITSLALNVGILPDQTMYNWTIRMKHITLSDYITASFDATGWTVVYQNNETIDTSGWHVFEFSTPFEYNDANNLMVDFSYNDSNCTNYGYCQSSSTSGVRTACAYTNSDYGDPLEWSGTYPPYVSGYERVPNLRLNICAEGDSAPSITGWEIAATHGGGLGEIWCAVEEGYIESRVSGIRKLRVCFNRPMDTSVTDPNEVSIFGANSGTQPAPCSIEWDGVGCMIITMCSALPDLDCYNIWIGSGVVSQSGYAIEGDIGICLIALKGDANASRSINAQDLLAVRTHAGQTIDCGNARYDINCSGGINAQDLLAARQYAGNGVPECPFPE